MIGSLLHLGLITLITLITVMLVITLITLITHIKVFHKIVLMHIYPLLSNQMQRRTSRLQRRISSFNSKMCKLLKTIV